jgi:hypothetical protein
MAVTGVFGKLQLKDQTDIVVLDAPASFDMELRALKGVRVHRKLDLPSVEFAIAFVIRQPDLEAHARALAKRAEGDAVIWFAYPKGSSKRYRSELTRDTGWQVLGDLGFEAVRMVAIDQDWSAARFRRAAFIKTMKRDASRAMSKGGKARTQRRRGAQ